MVLFQTVLLFGDATREAFDRHPVLGGVFSATLLLGLWTSVRYLSTYLYSIPEEAQIGLAVLFVVITGGISRYYDEVQRPSYSYRSDTSSTRSSSPETYDKADIQDHGPREQVASRPPQEPAPQPTQGQHGQPGPANHNQPRPPISEPPQSQPNPQPQPQPQENKGQPATESEGPAVHDDHPETSTYLSDVPDRNFEGVAGMEDLKQELYEKIIDPLSNPKKYDKYNISVEHGVLLHGPPGTGKTYLSKALAGELGISYMRVKGADVVSKWVGEETTNVTELFDEARENQPCMLFIDELDAIVPERSSANQHQTQNRLVNMMLDELSEIHDNEDDVIVVGATNRKDVIDDAMLRPGRLSIQIEVPNPDEMTRIAILDHHLTDHRVDEFDTRPIMEWTEGFSAADMEQMAEEAGRQAMRRDDKVRQEDVEEAAVEVVKGKDDTEET
jgi:SpoVK/Ycf46/Vps4 family AAA+-type ATPase